MKTDLMCLAKSIEEIYAHLLKKQSIPRQGTESVASKARTTSWKKQSIPRQGTETLIGFNSLLLFVGNNQYPARGRKQDWPYLQIGFQCETINTPPGDGNGVLVSCWLGSS